MEQSVASLLEKLAAELGTTVAYLWPLLVRQQFIEALATIIGTVLCSAFLLSVLAYEHRVMQKRMLSVKGYKQQATREWVTAARVISVFLVLIAVVIILTATVTLMNAEASALQELLRRVK